MYTFISGACGYLGRAFCRLCLENGENLYLTGRDETRLETLRDELVAQYPDADIRFFACDLSDCGERDALFENASSYVFSKVINCAGADVQKPVASFSQSKLTFTVRSNFEGIAAICLFAVSHGGDALHIINISSVSGIYPMPYFALYSAAKGALTSFSLSLGREMKGKGVYVTAVLPGAFYSRPDVVEYIEKQGAWAKIAAKTPEYVAIKSLKASQRHKKKYIPGVGNKLMNFFTRLVPSGLRTHYIARRWSKTTKDGFGE